MKPNCMHHEHSGSPTHSIKDCHWFFKRPNSSAEMWVVSAHRLLATDTLLSDLSPVVCDSINLLAKRRMTFLSYVMTSIVCHPSFVLITKLASLIYREWIHTRFYADIHADIIYNHTSGQYLPKSCRKCRIQWLCVEFYGCGVLPGPTNWWGSCYFCYDFDRPMLWIDSFATFIFICTSTQLVLRGRMYSSHFTDDPKLAN